MRQNEADSLVVRLAAVGLTATPYRFSDRTENYGWAVRVHDAAGRDHLLAHDMSGGYLLLGNPTPVRDFETLVGRLLDRTPEVDHVERAQQLLAEASESANVLGGGERAGRLIAEAQVHATLATAPVMLDAIELVGEPLSFGTGPDTLIGDGHALDRIAAAIASDLGYVETLGEIEVLLRKTGRTVTG